MKHFHSFFDRIPAALSSTPSIFIFIFLFVYLFIFGFMGLFVKVVEPSSDVQLVFGNYTNVLSALGAALAAGAGSKHTQKLKELHEKHDSLQASIDQLHEKIDTLGK